MDQLERDTIVVDSRDTLWRVRAYPNHVQLFLSRELAEARAREIACSRIPAWTIIILGGDG